LASHFCGKWKNGPDRRDKGPLGAEKLFVAYAGDPVEVFDRLTGWLSRSAMVRRPTLTANPQWTSANAGVEFTMRSSEPEARTDWTEAEKGSCTTAIPTMEL
jgi:hypothetical protein